MTKQEFAEKYGFNSSVGAFGLGTKDCRKELLTDLDNVIKALGLTDVGGCNRKSSKYYSDFPKILIDLQGVITKADECEFTMDELDEFNDALIDIVEKRNYYFGGGMGLVSKEEYNDQFD